MTGWLIISAFLKGSNYDRIYQWLLDAAKQYKIELILKTNADVLVSVGFQNDNIELPDFVLFWDKDIRLAEYLEGLGIPVYNPSRAIRICDDKSQTHLVLSEKKIKMPRTIIAPMTFENIGYTDYDFLDNVVRKLDFPMVVKECFGSFGQQVYFVQSEAELFDIVKKIGAKPMLFQEYIAASKGQDIRIQVVGDRVIAGMNRYSTNGDFRANITIGGSMRTYKPTSEEEELAITVCKELGLVFGGVDLLFSEDGEKYVCEVNSNAHFRGIYECCKVNAAEEILSEIIQRIK